MYKFTNGIVVFDEKTRDDFIKAGYKLVDEDKRDHHDDHEFPKTNFHSVPIPFLCQRGRQGFLSSITDCAAVCQSSGPGIGPDGSFFGHTVLYWAGQRRSARRRCHTYTGSA